MDGSQVSLQKIRKHPGVLGCCHKKTGAPTASVRVRNFLVGPAVLASLQWELNRIQLLISYILPRVRPRLAGKNRVPAATSYERTSLSPRPATTLHGSQQPLSMDCRLPFVIPSSRLALRVGRSMTGLPVRATKIGCPTSPISCEVSLVPHTSCAFP